MKRIVTVRDVIIGEGAPKICVPMVGHTIEKLQEEAAELRLADQDIIEWRADFFIDVESLSQVKEALWKIREIIPHIPLLFTFRTKKEGGEREIDLAYYLQLNKAMIESKLVDLVDLELFTGEKALRSLIELAHDKGVSVVLSNHDFEKTPSKEEIIARLIKAQELGGDLPKIAVMPRTRQDVLTLLDATLTMSEHYADRPIITMSMAGLGMVSRLAGEVFGSALTFGAYKKSSAPGQIPAAELREILSLLHEGGK